MKTICSLIAIILISIPPVAGLKTQAQQTQQPAQLQSPNPKHKTAKQKSSQKEKVKAGFGVTVVQTQPEFPGGQDSLLSYLKKNIHYPQQAQTKREEGQVYVGFMIDTTGKIRDAKIVNGINDDLDAEALRVVQSMPDWKPGTAGG